MATYTWLTGGGGPITIPTSPATPTNVDLSLPGNALLHRIQLRYCSIFGYSAGTTNTSMNSMGLDMTWKFTTGKYAGRTIFYTRRQVPWVVTVFLATAIPAYNAWYNAGDNEMGINERCQYGGKGAPASNLRFTWFPYSIGVSTFNWSAAINYQVAALYSV